MLKTEIMTPQTACRISEANKSGGIVVYEHRLFLKSTSLVIDVDFPNGKSIR
jgi:hypothetical protein